MSSSAILFLTVFFACAARDQAPLPDPTPAQDGIRYVVQTNERRAGELVVHPRDDGYRAAYRYDDRGRGPDLHSEVVLGTDGLPTRMRIHGTDYLGAPVEEVFEGTGDGATWHSTSEQGSSEAKGFYLPIEGTPAEIATLARVLLDRPERSLALLPTGEARIREVARLDVAQGDATRSVALQEILGMGFEPSYVWLDAEERLFAQVSSWGSTVLEGWEQVDERLLARQQEAEAERLREMAGQVARHPTGPVVFQDVTVFDPRARALVGHRTVIVEGERIVTVGAAEDTAIPEDATVFEGEGQTLLPGLWDMHVHVRRARAGLHLAGGVTSARDLGNPLAEGVETRRAFDEGAILGPRLLLSGLLDGPGELAAPTGRIVDTEEEVRVALDEMVEADCDQVKIYSSIRPGLVPVIATEAQERGLRVSGHVPAFMSAADAVEAGFDEIQHANMLVLNFLPDVEDTRTPERFTAVAERAADLDLDDPAVQDFVDLLRNEQVVVDPTLAIFEHLFAARPGEPSPTFAAVHDRLPPRIQRWFGAGGLPVPEGMDERYRRSHRALLAFVRRLHEADVRLVAGTDYVGGFTLHRELELYVEAGIPPADVLHIATLGAAEVAGRDERLGTVEPGMLADLVLVQGDPLEGIDALRRPVLTVKGGVLFEPRRLYALYGVEPR